MRIDKKYIIAILFIVCFLIIYFYLFNKWDRSILNFITLLGTFASLFGLIIALLQIKSIKKISEQTKQEVEKSLEHLNLLLSLSDLAKSNLMIREIMSHVKSGKYELAHIRMSDLKNILIEIQNKENLKDYIGIKKYSQYVIDLTIDMKNVYYFLINNKNEVEFNKISDNLEDLSTIIIDLENRIKSRKLWKNN
jgi:predicted nucleotidyltransferase